MEVKLNSGLIRKKGLHRLFAAYIVYLIFLTLSPFEFSIVWLNRLLDYEIQRLLRFIFYFRVKDILGNVLIFIPLGICLAFMNRQTGNNRSSKRYYGPILIGALLSGFIELTQLFLPRFTNFFDVASNVAGTLVGYTLVERWFSGTSVRKRLPVSMGRFAVLCLLILYSGTVIFLVFLPPGLNHLNNWDEGYPLIVGNERTLDRPWNGEIYLVAIYNQALRKGGVRRLYQSGWSDSDVAMRRRMGVVALYTFEAGTGDTVYDRSGFGDPLHLHGRNIDWVVGKHGVAIGNKAFLKTLNAAGKVGVALRDRCQMTVEVWIYTKNLNQQGPARIVSYSHNLELRNFTLGQAGRDIHMRVRTPLTGPNGSLIHLKAKDVLRDDAEHHIVATFHRGVERLFVDGQPCTAGIQGDIDYLPVVMGFGNNTIVKLGFCYLIILPWCILLHFTFRKRRYLFKMLIILGFVSGSQVIYMILFGQSFGWLFITASLSVAILGGYLVSFWDKASLNDARSEWMKD